MIDLVELRTKVDTDIQYYNDLIEKCKHNCSIIRKPGTVGPTRQIWSRAYCVCKHLEAFSETLKPIEAKGQPL